MYAQSLAKHIYALNLPSLQVWTSTLQRTKATSANIQAPQQHLHELDEIWSVSKKTNLPIFLYIYIICIYRVVQMVTCKNVF